jgi:hypothetical protein
MSPVRERYGKPFGRAHQEVPRPSHTTTGAQGKVLYRRGVLSQGLSHGPSHALPVSGCKSGFHQ